jgi:nifR3 family TIM-barrel protein
MKDPRKAAEIVSVTVKALKQIPVTVKIRAGWDDDTKNAPEVAQMLEDAGASLICVHARTREQMYNPGIDISIIEKVKNAVSIPVIGNGDITNATDAVYMMKKTGCDGVMIGRGAMGNPWIFSEIDARLRGEDYVFPTVAERLAIAISHLDDMLIRKGERVGLAEAKKHMAWYLTGICGASSARNEIMVAQDRDGVLRVLYKLLAENE